MNNDISPLTYTVEEVADLLGIGRSLAYDMVARHTIPVLRLGRRLVVPRAAFQQWLLTVGT